MLKEIIFYTYGDSNNAKTWSNVPYLFAHTLEEKGIIIRRININPNRILNRLYNSLLFPILQKITPGSIYTYDRTLLCHLLTNHRIKQSLKRYPNAEMCIFSCYDYYNKFDNRKTVLFCDWTANILIKERFQREPYYSEKEFIKRQYNSLRKADYVISLFKECAESIKQECPECNIHFLGNNVINSFYNDSLNTEDIIKRKIKKENILFIGGDNYTEAACKLIKANHILKDKYTIHIIGLTEKETGIVNPKVIYHGYLNKSNPDECKEYYDTLINSCLIVNATQQWAGYSSVIEAMYFYTPVLISPYKDFVSEFGENIEFGTYNQEFTEEVIANNITKILSSDRYEYMCQNAHEKVKNYTWEEYVNRFIELINNK